MKTNSLKSSQLLNNETTTSLLEQTKEILIDLNNDLEKMKNIWSEIRTNNPTFEQVSHEQWREKSSRCWLHGGTKKIETDYLDQWLIQKVELSKLAHGGVRPLIVSWKKRMNEKGPMGHYYADDVKFTIKSKKDETLLNFIIRMARNTEEFGKGHRLSWRALKSFLSFLRETRDQKEVAFIEQIFPVDMDVAHGRIIRKIPPEVYSIPLETAGDIILELAIMCRECRPNAFHGLAETLGLCWLCLTASRLRLPTEVEMIYKTKASSINLKGDFPTILIPTIFGDQSIRISLRVAKFFLFLSKIPSEAPREAILQKPFRSLSRSFDRVLERVSPNPDFGNITFLTLISPPHIFGENHRFIPK